MKAAKVILVLFTLIAGEPKLTSIRTTGSLSAATLTTGKVTCQEARRQDARDKFGQQVDGLHLRVSAVKRRFQQWESIDVKLVFQNVGGETMVLLPGSLDFKVEGPAAWYSPHEGTVPPFLSEVQVLEPGRLAVLELVNLDDGDGRWVVKPGICQINASYSVRPPTKNSKTQRSRKMCIRTD